MRTTVVKILVSRKIVTSFIISVSNTKRYVDFQHHLKWPNGWCQNLHKKTFTCQHYSLQDFTVRFVCSEILTFTIVKTWDFCLVGQWTIKTKTTCIRRIRHSQQSGQHILYLQIITMKSEIIRLLGQYYIQEKIKVKC